MKKHAVLITVLFALSVSLICVSAIFLEFYKLNKQQHIDHIFTKYSVITQIYRDHQQRQNSETMLDANLAVYKMQIVKEEKEQKAVLDKGTILKREGFESLSASLMYDENGFYTQNKVTKLRATMIRHNKFLYFHIQTKNAGILIKDEQLTPYNYLNILYAFSTIFMIISRVYQANLHSYVVYSSFSEVLCT